VAALGVGAALCACVGCGDDADGDPPAPEPDTPAAVVAEMAATLAAADRKSDCHSIDELNELSAYELPCPLERPSKASMATLEVVDAEAFGDGAVVDYTARDDGEATILLARAPSGGWGISRYGLTYGHSVGSDDARFRTGYLDTIEEYLDGLERRRCATFLRTAVVTSDDDAYVCRVDFPATERIAEVLAANPGAELDYLGGNARYGFARLTTTRPRTRQWVLSAVKTKRWQDDSRYRIADIVETTAGESP
jgi:hypothetical protein